MWQEIKEEIRNEYVDLDDTTIEFYKIALDKYAEETECESDIDLLNNLYSEGIVSKKAIRNYQEETEANELRKEANNFTDGLKGGLGYGAAGLGLSLGVAGLAKGYNYLSNKLSRKKRLAAIFKYHPTLRNADQDYINMALSDIERLNPDVAKSPLISGTAIKNQIYANEGFTPEQAGIIANIGPRQNDYQKMIIDNTMSAANKGMEQEDEYTGSTKEKLDLLKMEEIKSNMKKKPNPGIPWARKGQKKGASDLIRTASSLI